MKHFVCKVLIGIGIVLSLSLPAQADDEKYDFLITNTDAKTALKALALKTKTPLLYPYDQVNSIMVTAIDGRYTIDQALGILLQGTGFQGSLTERGVIVISRTDNQSSVQEEPMQIKMTKKKLIGSASAAILAAATVAPVSAQEQSGNEYFDEIITIGSRSAKPRSAADSPVPVDVISADDLNAMGGTVDLTDNLKNLIPSYTATPATGDTSAFVRPTSLRGTAPDETLVLVNGKRRHRSAVIQFFAPAAGNGAQGVDIGMIPSIALERVEVLRDGAASQYGSDAIAGVINFVTKDASEGGTYQVQYGQHYQGEASYKIGFNQGFALGDNGFANLSFEYSDNEALSRGLQRPDAQALIDSGVQGVGYDAPFGDAPLVQTWGRPETDAMRFFLNSGIDINENLSLYARAGYSEANGRYRFFYRAPGDDDDGAALDFLVTSLGFTGPRSRTGYTPFLDGAQKDISLSTGAKGQFSGGTSYDFSFGYGQNKLALFLNNEINPGLGLTASGEIPQTDFVMGGYEQEEISLNADFSTPISDTLNLAYGAEWRQEAFTANAGERNSYIDATGQEGAGVDGRISPSDAGRFSRNNFALYADVEHDITDRLLIQYAARYENYSDFGSTVNGKVAGRYRVTDNFALRGAVSTGFKAPTPGQANIKATISTFDGLTGALVLEGLISATDPRAIAVGGKALTEEKSLNLSAGITSNLSANTTLTVDVYKIGVDNRIYRSGDITALDGSSISFYTNALDVNYSGVDLVLTSRQEWSGNTSTDFSLAYSYNKINVVQQRAINGVNPVTDATVEDIENNYPKNRFTLTANTYFGEKWNLMARANYYGSHYDERGTIGAAVNPSAKIGAVTYFDAELGYKLNDNVTLAVGGSNIFDTFVDTIGAPNANRLSVGLQYPRRSAANYEGGSWYVRASYNF